MKARVVIVVVGSLCPLMGQWANADLFNDGGVHDIIGGSYDHIDVDNPPPASGAYSTVNVGAGVEGNLFTYNASRATVNAGSLLGSIEAHDWSQVTTNGCTFSTWLYAYDESQVMVSPGSRFWSTEAHDWSEVTMNGGEVSAPFYAYDQSQVTVNGGSAMRFEAHDSSEMTVNTAYANHFSVYDNGQMTINGGMAYESIVAGGMSQMTINGGAGAMLGLFVRDYSTVTVNGGHTHTINTSGMSRTTLVGSDFAVYRDSDGIDLAFSGYGVLDKSFSGCFLWGTLADGTACEFRRLIISEDSLISFSPVPLPGAVLLGLIGLAYAGHRLRRV